MFWGDARWRPVTLVLLLGIANAADLAYITDLPLYSSLARCAGDAITTAPEPHTKTGWCHSDVTRLQACICTASLDAVSNSIRSSVIEGCGYAATEHQSSANTVLKKYCDQDAITLTFPTYTYSPITKGIDDIDVFTELAPCAQWGLQSAIGTITRSYSCPTQGPKLASCLCSDSQHSKALNSVVKTAVDKYCSDNSADVASARDVFAGYCSLAKGMPFTPTFTSPPGNMWFHITDMSEYTALPPCGKSALSGAVLSQSTSLCPSLGPQALASCVCIKEKISDRVSSMLTLGARTLTSACSSGGSDALSSATKVLDLYCSAAKAQTYLYLETRVGDPQMDGDGFDDDDDDARLGTGVIVAVVLGSALGAVLALGATLFCLMKRRAGVMAKAAGQVSPIPPSVPPATSSRAPGPPGDIPLSGVNRKSAPPPYEAGSLSETSTRKEGNATAR